MEKSEEKKPVSGIEKVEMQNQAGEVVNLDCSLLDNFFRHPFKLHSGTMMQELVESIKENGVLVPLLVRIKENNRYEILSGHNRREGAKLAGVLEVPCIVLDVDDDAAVMVVTEANLQQRQSLLPSERARAYAMQLEVLKRQEKNFDKFLENPDENKEYSVLSHGGTNELDSRNSTIHRYLKLNNLSSNLLLLVDDKVLSINAGVELSYLNSQSQQAVYEYFFVEQKVKLTEQVAKLIREHGKKKQITGEELMKILHKETKPKQMKKLVLPYKKIDRYIPDDLSVKQQQAYVIEALAFYNKHKGQET